MMFGGEHTTFESFLPYPDALNEFVPPVLSKKTARILKRLYDSGVILPRTWGGLLDLSNEIEKA